MNKSKILWTKASWNPATGCSKASAGCENCYAENMARRLKAMGKKEYSNGFTPTCHPQRLNEPFTWKEPTLVFVCSMGDLFHPLIPEEFIEKVMPKYELTREAYEQDAFETFKEKFCEVFMAASLYISIEDKLAELLKRHDDANLIMLVESAMEDISEFMTVRFSNVVSLLMEGMPQELAEKIAEDAGDAVIAPIGISFGIDDDDEEDDCGCDCESECNGECGGRCSCEGKDECDDGHCCIKDSND